MELGDTVPSISFKSTNSQNISFQDYRGQWIILYFYPKDATPGCTLEGCDFRDHNESFARANACVLGVSRDSLSSHTTFRTKQNFPFDLISDSEETLCQLFDVIKMKSMYGKQVRGIERSTFIIDPQGVLRHAWRKVKVAGHVATVLQTLEALQDSHKKTR